MSENMSTEPAFSILEEGPDHFLVQHTNGAAAPVAKGMLSEEQQQEMRERLPKAESKLNPMVVGALTPEPQPDSFDQFLSSRGKEDIGQRAMAAQPGYVPVEKPLAPEIVEGLKPQLAPEVVQGLAGIEPQQAQTVPQMPSPFDKNFNMMTSGIQKAANAQAQGQELAAQAAQEYRNSIQTVQKDYAAQRAELDKQQEALENDYKNGKVDPNRFWNEKKGFSGGVSRVLSMIGLFLGGNAQLKTGVNPAQAMLQDAINKDIDAQKEELGKKKNLLSMNYDKYKNLAQAEAATKLDNYNMFTAQLQQYAAQTNSPVIKANAMKEIAAINLQRDQLKDGMAKQAALNNLINRPEGVPDAALGLLPKEQAALMVRVGTNQNVPARSEKDAQELREAQPAIKNAMKLVQELKQDMEEGRVEKAVAGDIPLLRGHFGAGEQGLQRQAEIIKALQEVGRPLRINEYTNENFTKALVPNPAQWQREEAKEKLLRLEKDLQGRLNQAYSSRLMTYDPASVNVRKGLAK